MGSEMCIRDSNLFIRKRFVLALDHKAIGLSSTCHTGFLPLQTNGGIAERRPDANASCDKNFHPNEEKVAKKHSHHFGFKVTPLDTTLAELETGAGKERGTQSNIWCCHRHYESFYDVPGK